ncbi:cell wall-binding repeat-containing protein [Metaclostridioides mangenotii]|uniref:cell wall-binding repeat-containing protein n=1 Tax=Metaclostridioides mangenotii TaxID=1540 RepID=UPI0026F129BF|nr:cell wall-binding repeat-containing protein [Clostridioides mangenotii]
MNKKRNLAVLMAAATVATSVAPVFAAEAADLNEESLRAKVQELLNVKYSDPSEEGGDTEVATGDFKNSVYMITGSIDGATGKRIKNITDLNKLIEDANVADKDLVVSVQDKGHIKTEDGKIVTKIKTKNNFVNVLPTIDEIKDESPAIKEATVLDIDGEDVEKTSKTPVTLEVELMGGKKFNVEVGDYLFDYDKPLDASGNKIENLSENSDDSVKKKVASFELHEDKTEATFKTKPASIFAEYTMGSKVTLEKNLSDYYSKDGGYTKAGVDLVEKLRDAVGAETDIVIDGVKYDIKGISANADDSVIKATNDGYELTINFQYKKADKEKWYDIKLVLKGNNQADLSRVKNDIISKNDVVVGRLTTLAGDDRFATAVEISKDAYVNDGAVPKDGKVQADAVVLVGENAIVDGLASAPLAKQKNAPILLTKADSIPAETMNEIKRIVDKGTDIYLIGGENTISKAVETQLKKELNASIKRISGNDRYATSTEIADELNSTLNTEKEAYVVGGEGLADAMSIAAYAAQTNAPILVNPSDKLSKDVKVSLKDEGITKVTVIGGTSHISTQVIKDLDEEQIAATRISGSDRTDTNAKVIEEYYKDGFTDSPKANATFIAKDGYVGGNGQLIDALAVAPSAAKAQAPIVLTHGDLTQDQEDNLRAYYNKNNVKKDQKVYQVGQGIAAEALKTVLKIFDL